MTLDMTPEQTDLALALLHSNAIQFGHFTERIHEQKPGAPLVPFDLSPFERPGKGGALTPEIFGRVVQSLANTARQRHLDLRHVCGVSKAAEPFANGLLDAFKDPRLGKIALGKTDLVLLVEPVLRDTVAIHEAIQALERSELRVHDILVLVDCEQGAGDELRCRGLKVHCVFSLIKLAMFYVKRGLITPKTLNEVLAYLAARHHA